MLARERPLHTPREVPQSWPRGFRCWHGCWEPSGREFGWLGVVDMDGSPSRAILISYLIRVWNSPNHEWALPSWGQLVGTLGSSRHREDEVSLAAWVGSDRSWRWGYLLVGEGEVLFHCLHI